MAAALSSSSAWADTPDEERSTGREVIPAHPRPELPIKACSFREPVCVHAPQAVSPWVGSATLRAAERALRGYRALGFPPPRPPYDVYLVPESVAEPMQGPETLADLVPSSDGWDRASAFTILPEPPRPTCAIDFQLVESVGKAIALGFDAGAEASALSMFGSYMATVIAPCPALEAGAVDDFQAHPERSFASMAPDSPDGALLFPWFLDDAIGVGGPGRAMLGLIAIASQRTPVGSWEWNNEPDVFDILRATMKARGSTADKLLLDFAVARAFVGSRSDGEHLRDVDRYGDEGRVRFEWSVGSGTLPRRLAPRSAIDPTGMTYLWLDLTTTPPPEVTFVADWEPPSLFRWSLVKVDPTGAEVGRQDVAGVYGDVHAEKTVVGLDGLAGLLIVGVNVGSVDRKHPFDPDEQPLSPHGYTVTLFK